MVSPATRGGLYAVLLVLSGLWLPPVATADLDDLLWEFQVVPLEGIAPPFRLSRLDGERVSLADFRGRPVLLYFWATW